MKREVVDSDEIEDNIRRVSIPIYRRDVSQSVNGSYHVIRSTDVEPRIFRPASYSRDSVVHICLKTRKS